ncbi:hypothetical protein CASFOL_017666 [Castilleja foliolosa]|uniref:Xyloglucan endotransglucosylase/hydrolase n=1 Tax=Castilleja foliolosa TaxID=1961234 RepID=A0ABD3D7L2_9LAMI
MESFVLKVVIVMAFLLASSSAGNFYRDVKITYGDHSNWIEKNGQLISLSLDNNSGSGFESKNMYLYSRFDMQLKLIPGNSAGTVTTFYLSSEGSSSSRDEIDFEFLGNVSGQPYTVHTNIYIKGFGNREQQFSLWFDPTAAFHDYTIIWDLVKIIFMVDNIPIRVFTNFLALGVPFPVGQPMRMHASLWNADDWATQGGKVKIDWSKAPFKATYKNLNIDGCVVKGTSNSCKGAWQTRGLDANETKQLQWVQDKYMIYNYCDDAKRFPHGRPKECRLPRF